MAIQKVNEYKEITFSYSSNGEATLQFYSDMPGGALAARLGAGITLPDSSSLRVTYTIPLDSGGPLTAAIEGTEFQVKITPGASTQFRLFSGHVKLRLIGIYLDGSTSPQGEVWFTQPIAVGA